MREIPMNNVSVTNISMAKRNCNVRHDPTSKIKATLCIFFSQNNKNRYPISGIKNVSSVCKWITCTNWYVENPKRRPAITPAINDCVRYFMIRKVKNADSAFPIMIKMLKETTGPKISVIGRAIKLAPGTDAGANDKSVPYGCQI